MTPLDFKKELKHLYQPSAKGFEVVDVPSMKFLMVDGHGDPNIEPAYQEAVESLYSVAYKLKFASKRERGQDYVVPPLEGLWWAENTDVFTVARDKGSWDWTMMIMQPDWITLEMFRAAVQQAAKVTENPTLTKVRFEVFHEGLAVQILYTGAYDDEGPLIAQLHQEFLPRHSFEPVGKHHEIYLSDPRRVAPPKLKTVIRQPVRKASA